MTTAIEGLFGSSVHAIGLPFLRHATVSRAEFVVCRLAVRLTRTGLRTGESTPAPLPMAGIMLPEPVHPKLFAYGEARTTNAPDPDRLAGAPSGVSVFGGPAWNRTRRSPSMLAVCSANHADW